MISLEACRCTSLRWFINFRVGYDRNNEDNCNVSWLLWTLRYGETILPIIRNRTRNGQIFCNWKNNPHLYHKNCIIGFECSNDYVLLAPWAQLIPIDNKKYKNLSVAVKETCFFFCLCSSDGRVHPTWKW